MSGRYGPCGGFAVLAVTAVLTLLGVLAWTVSAPTALQQRAASAAECRAQARAAARAGLREARLALESGAGEGAVPAGDGSGCSPEPWCYTVEPRGGYHRVTAIGSGCREQRAVIKAGVRLAAGPEARLRWQRSE